MLSWRIAKNFMKVKNGAMAKSAESRACAIGASIAASGQKSSTQLQKVFMRYDRSKDKKKEKSFWEEVFIVLSNPVKRVSVSNNWAQDQNADS